MVEEVRHLLGQIEMRVKIAGELTSTIYSHEVKPLQTLLTPWYTAPASVSFTGEGSGVVTMGLGVIGSGLSVAEIGLGRAIGLMAWGETTASSLMTSGAIYSSVPTKELVRKFAMHDLVSIVGRLLDDAPLLV